MTLATKFTCAVEPEDTVRALLFTTPVTPILLERLTISLLFVTLG
jgi:hypothetical protein